MKVLIALECSGVIREAFLKKGHDAWSCDLKDSEMPTDRHLKGDIRNYLDLGWDLMIGHPVCTYNSLSNAQWYYHPDDKGLPKHLRRPHPKYPDRRERQKESIQLFKDMWNAPIKKKCLENPMPLSDLTKEVGMYHQIVQPYYFGDSFQKPTCLWLKNLPPLIPTKVVERGEFIITKSGNRIPKWYSDAKVASKEKTQSDRSRTFPGLAEAMASQWGHPDYENYLPTLFDHL